MKKKSILQIDQKLKWCVPSVICIEINATNGKFDTWPNEGGPGAGDRCTNPNNPNYNPNGWVCISRGPS